MPHQRSKHRQRRAMNQQQDNTKQLTEEKTRKPLVCRATQLTPAWHLLKDTSESVALDIEFQEYKLKTEVKWSHRVGRVAIVNTNGETVLDVYAQYPFREGFDVKVPPRRFGVTMRDLTKASGAVPAVKVERWVKDIVTDREVIMHACQGDMRAFMIIDGVWDKCKVIRDTQVSYSAMQRNGKPGLATLAANVLGQYIQGVSHDPVEDARTTMKLWLLKKQEKEEKKREWREEVDKTKKLNEYGAKENGGGWDDTW